MGKKGLTQCGARHIIALNHALSFSTISRNGTSPAGNCAIRCVFLVSEHLPVNPDHLGAVPGVLVRQEKLYDYFA
jgi:hypothetical protein